MQPDLHRWTRRLEVRKTYSKIAVCGFFNWSILKEFADDNLKMDENSRKFIRQVEKTVGKGETACYKQLLLLPQCFKKTCTIDM